MQLLDSLEEMQAAVLSQKASAEVPHRFVLLPRSPDPSSPGYLHSFLRSIPPVLSCPFLSYSLFRKIPPLPPFPRQLPSSPVQSSPVLSSLRP